MPSAARNNGAKKAKGNLHAEIRSVRHPHRPATRFASCVRSLGSGVRVHPRDTDSEIQPDDLNLDMEHERRGSVALAARPYIVALGQRASVFVLYLTYYHCFSFWHSNNQKKDFANWWHLYPWYFRCLFFDWFGYIKSIASV